MSNFVTQKHKNRTSMIDLTSYDPPSTIPKGLGKKRKERSREDDSDSGIEVVENPIPDTGKIGPPRKKKLRDSTNGNGGSSKATIPPRPRSESSECEITGYKPPRFPETPIASSSRTPQLVPQVSARWRDSEGDTSSRSRSAATLSRDASRSRSTTATASSSGVRRSGARKETRQADSNIDCIEISDADDTPAPVKVKSEKKTEAWGSANQDRARSRTHIRRKESCPRQNIQQPTAGPSTPPRSLAPVLSPGYLEKPVEIDGEEESDSGPPGLDVDDPYQWAYVEFNSNKLVNEHIDSDEAYESADDPDDAIERLAALRLTRAREVRRPNITRPYPVLNQINNYKPFLTDVILNAVNVKRGALQPPRPLGPADAGYRRPPLADALECSKLQVTTSFKQCRGSIMRIAQQEGWVVIGGAVTGGKPDEEKETIADLAYNDPGSLMTYYHQRQRVVPIRGASSYGDDALMVVDDVPSSTREGKQVLLPAVILPGHQAKRRFSGSEAIKNYQVNDAVFCPHPGLRNTFVTSGNDGVVNVWKYDNQGSHKRYRLHRFGPTNVPQKKQPKKYIPNALAFKPDSTTLAVGERSVYIFLNLEEMAAPTKLRGGDQPNQNVGEMRWGTGASKGFLFASSEPEDDVTFDGSWHHGYDLNRGGSENVTIAFDTDEAGDSMAMDPDGSRLFISTRESNSQGTLRIYDLRRRDGRAHTTVELERFSKPMNRDHTKENRPWKLEGEVRDAAVSPDGVFIALARYDNRIHVYDSRFTGKSLLYDFQHDGKEVKTNPNETNYGATKLEWVMKGNRMGLLTAGNDGCVRLWDPLQAADNKKNGAAIARVDSDIATFSLGDRFKGDHQLVIGDCAGKVTIMDRNFDPDIQNHYQDKWERWRSA